MKKALRLLSAFALAGLALACAGAPACNASGPPPESLHLFWPRFPRPATLLTVKDVPSQEHSILLQTLAGLAAREARAGRGREMIWVPIDHPAYERWQAAMLKQTGAKREPPAELWELVARFKRAGVVKGYVLYRYEDSARGFHESGKADVSVNVATALCGSLGAIAISEKLEAEAREQGLARLMDTRGMTEEECFEKYRDRFTRRTLAMIEPKVGTIRAEAVALDAFVMSQYGPLYEKALAWLEPGSPILGWGLGDEFRQTEPPSRWGHFQTATNWCLNLPPLSTETPGAAFPAARLRVRPAKTVWDVRWEENVHYAAFVMSDGDNVQWLMGNFLEDNERAWWANPARGKVPMGWTYCGVDLAQLCPYALDYLRQTATPRDDFVLLGGGYFYPDLFGKSRANYDAPKTHAARLAPYLAMSDVRLMLFNAMAWDSDDALRAYAAFARGIPTLEGILAVQYAPYTAGGGAVKWVKDARGSDFPIVSARFGIWAQANRPREGSPSRVAEMLNAMPHAGAPASADYFSWVIVHAWSYFKPRAAGAPPESEEVDQALGGKPDTARGLSPVQWCVEALQPHVRAVTPSELVLLMRLRLRPQQTLAAALADLNKHLASLPPERRPMAAAQMAQARSKLAAGDYRGCHEAGKAVARMLQDITR